MLDLDAIQVRADLATGQSAGADSAFIAESRTDVPALVAELRAARAVIEPTRAYQKLTEEERAFEPSTDALLWHEDLVAALAAYDKVTGEAAERWAEHHPDIREALDALHDESGEVE